MSTKDYLAISSLMIFYSEELDKYYNAIHRIFEIEKLLKEKSFENFDRLIEEQNELCEYIDFQKAYCEGILAAKDKMTVYFGLQ